MENNSKRLVLLLSLVLIIIPMVIFPNRLGMTLASGATLYMFFELVFYGAVFYTFRRDSSLVALIVASALTLVYRMALGAVLGMTIIIMYNINSSVAFSLGVTKYLPAVVLHVLAAPFVMRSMFLNLVESLVPSAKPQAAISPSSTETHDAVAPRATVMEKSLPENNDSGLAHRHDFQAPAAKPVYGDNDNLFERAMAYLGESGAVRMALLVSEEGLIMAGFNRSEEEDIEVWAPLTVSLERGNRQILNQFDHRTELDKLDITTSSQRVILRRIERLMLMILTDSDIDETIHIRIAQATDMMRKYMSERYSPSMFARVEENYVSNS